MNIRLFPKYLDTDAGVISHNMVAALTNFEKLAWDDQYHLCTKYHAPLHAGIIRFGVHIGQNKTSILGANFDFPIILKIKSKPDAFSVQLR